MGKESKGVERKIYFYRVDAGTDVDGNAIEFDPVPILEHIEEQPFSRAGRYWRQQDDSDICSVRDDSSSDQIRLRLWNSRRSGFPALESNGRLSKLRVPQDAGLAEQTHFIFFSSGIVGVEFNFYGPRAGRLANYFRVKAEGVGPEIQFLALEDRSVFQKLRHKPELRLFRMRIFRPYVDWVKQADKHLGGAFEAQAALGDMDELEVMVRLTKKDDRSLGKRLWESVLGLQDNRHLREATRQLQVRTKGVRESKLDEIDLLNDKLVSEKRVVSLDGGTRYLDSDSVYNAIESAYLDLKHQLLRARGYKV